MSATIVLDLLFVVLDWLVEFDSYQVTASAVTKSITIDAGFSP